MPLTPKKTASQFERNKPLPAKQEATSCSHEIKKLSADPRIVEIYRDYSGQLSASLRKQYGNGPPDPDDITHHAFLKLIERDNLCEIKNIKGYLWRTARNLLLNAKGAQKSLKRYDFELEHLFFPSERGNGDFETVLMAREELRAINETLRAMPEKRRRAFILHRIEGLSVSEVARRLRLSRSPADRHIIRAAAEIQQCLAKLRCSTDT